PARERHDHRRRRHTGALSLRQGDKETRGAGDTIGRFFSLSPCLLGSLSPSPRETMARNVTLFTGPWADLPLEELTPKADEWGYQGLELCCWGDHFEVQR